MKAHSATSAAVLLAAFFAGCAQDGTLMTSSLNTSAIDQQTAAQEAAKADPACLTLASQIEALTKDGIPDKVSKAAIKKYRMKTADLAKADELNKANAEFQTRCSSYPPSPTLAAASPQPPTPTPAAPKVASKAKPPVPAPKPVAAAMATQETGSLAQPPAQP
jgi:hypothetical protein